MGGRDHTPSINLPALIGDIVLTCSKCSEDVLGAA